MRELWGVGVAVQAYCGVGGCGLGGFQCGELWWEAVSVCGSCGVGRLRCGDDAMWGCFCGGNQGEGEFLHLGAVLLEMEELQCRSFGVGICVLGELQCGGVALRGSCIVGVLKCGGVTV